MANKKYNVLGVVGARSGSKGIPNKNIKLFAGKPLMAWIIEAGLKSKYINKLIVSTDSEEYANIAKQYGAEAPFIRPPELALDSVPDFDFLFHAAMRMKENENFKADIILRLPPTSPLCTTEHIDACVELLMNDESADSSRTIIKASKHPYKLWKIENNTIVPFLSEKFTGLKDAHNMPRQSFPEAYQHVDVIALRWNTLIEKKEMAGKRVLYHIVPKNESIDIDSLEDFLLAEILINKRNEGAK